MNVLFIVKDVDYIEPVGLMSISASARQAGCECHLCIASRQDVMAEIRRVRPRVIAYSVATGEHPYYVELNKKIKQFFPGVFTIMGGPHATFCPSMIQGTTLDALCIGEGEGAFRELLGAVEAGRPVEAIKNIVTAHSRHTEVRDLIADLDTVPFPDRKLFYDRTEMGNAPLKSFITSRGCPYACAYCFNSSFRELYQGKGIHVRRHSVDYVIDQIREVRSAYRLEFIKFYDDIFALQADEWLEEFADKYAAQVRLPFHCLTRADLLNDDVVRLLKHAGCRSISMSIELGSIRFPITSWGCRFRASMMKSGLWILISPAGFLLRNFPSFILIPGPNWGISALIREYSTQTMMYCSLRICIARLCSVSAGGRRHGRRISPYLRRSWSCFLRCAVP
jgi:anaerobic magnesium-protoporphyrin IX monomethyl ester cyclase